MKLYYNNVLLVDCDRKTKVKQVFHGATFTTKIRLLDLLIKNFYLWALHFIKHKNVNGMKKIFLELGDNVTAGLSITPSVDGDGNLQFTAQVVLQDTTANKSAALGSPFNVVLQDADLAGVNAAIAAVLTPLAQAQYTASLTAANS